ncbi:MAG: RNA polymerase subunit sigma-70 [Acidobacteria bacterium]|nr:MAG: RNA polymerase subunit sigma-70 [Acidobacteriota bacterium]
MRHSPPWRKTPRTPSGQVTHLLRQWQDGDRAALDRLIPLVYDELRVIASRYRAREWREGALQTTALVNEAYLKLIDQRHVDWHNRAHFFAVAAQLMRRILVDDARRQLREKRGGAAGVSVDDLPIAASDRPLDAVETLALDRALGELERLDPDQGRIVELRFFGGLTVEETAAAMRISPATVKREWAIAKGWLYRSLTKGEDRRRET